MSPRIRQVIVATLVLLVGYGAGDQGAATVIRDGRTASAGNPAVEAGGHRLTAKHPSPLPYSLIGAMADSNYWHGPPLVWPWRLFSPFTWRSHGIPNLFRIMRHGEPPLNLPALP